MGSRHPGIGIRSQHRLDVCIGRMYEGGSRSTATADIDDCPFRRDIPKPVAVERDPTFYQGIEDRVCAELIRSFTARRLAISHCSIPSAPRSGLDFL